MTNEPELDRFRTVSLPGRCGMLYEMLNFRKKIIQMRAYLSFAQHFLLYYEACVYLSTSKLLVEAATIRHVLQSLTIR